LIENIITALIITNDVFQKPRGTRDFLPDEMEKRRFIEDRLRETFIAFGYREVQTPTFEHLELFTAKSGEGILDEIYAFKDKSGRDLALRPELTAPVMRMYCEKLKREPKPLKLFYFGNCYRYDRPQKGRYREFAQAGCEIIGYNSQAYMAELIALAQALLKNVSLKDFKLRIGNLDFISYMLHDLSIGEKTRKLMFPLVDKKMFDEVKDLLEEEGFSGESINRLLDFFECKTIDELKEFIDNGQSIQEFEELLKFLEMFDIKDYEIDTAIVRGLDYYKGVVFEIDLPKLGAEKQICGGGSYELLPIFGEKPLPTAGFAMGFDRILVALEGEKIFPSKGVAAYIVPVAEDSLDYAVGIARKLRSAGISVDIDLGCRGLSKSLRYASSIGARNAIIIGEREKRENKITLRDMEDGKQRMVDLKELMEIFSERA